jgi:hypothetical protein
MPKLINLPAQPVPGVPLDQAIKGWLGDTWDDAIAAEKAQGSITFNYVPNVGDTLTVNGVTFTFIAGASAGTDIHIEATPGAQAAAVAAVLNASANGSVAAATYTNETHPLSGAPTGTITVSHDTGGSAGNQFTLKSSSSVNRMALNGARNAKLKSAAIEVTPTLTGGQDASTRYGDVVENFLNE